MSIIINVKPGQIKPKLYLNWRAQQTFAVNDDYTKGLEYGKLVGVTTGKQNGANRPVFAYAGVKEHSYTDIADTPQTIPALKPVGVIYDTSPRDQYERTDKLTDETRLFPMGSRQDVKMPPVDEWVWEITDTDQLYGNVAYFREIDRVVPTTSISSFDDATATIVLTGEVTDIRTEEKINVAGTEYYIEDIEIAGGFTTLTLNDGAGDVVTEFTIKSQLFEPVFLPDNMEGLPFTMLPYDENGDPRQQIGYVEGAIQVRGKIEHK